MYGKIILFSVLLLQKLLYAQETDIKSIPDYQAVSTRINLKDAVMTADQAPEFPGGMMLFQRKVAENTEVLYLKKSQKLETRVYFIVEKDGYIRNIAAVGNNKIHAEAAEKGIRRVFTRWKPATVNGEAVRFLYTFPLSTKRY